MARSTGNSTGDAGKRGPVRRTATGRFAKKEPAEGADGGDPTQAVPVLGGEPPHEGRAVPPPPGGVLPTTRRGMLRYRVLPRSVVGLSMMILSFAVGAGFSGVVLYSYYQYRQSQTDSKVNALINGYKDQFAKAEADLNAAAQSDKADIANQLRGAQNLQAGPSQLAAITKQVSPSVFFVHTLGTAGQPSVGTAFVVSSNSTQSLLLTSYATVAAATRNPAPPVYVTQGAASAQTPVTLSTWDPQYDLALLIMHQGGLPPLTAAPPSPAPQPGDRLFAVSGLGTAGASLEQGAVLDVSSDGLQVDSQIGLPFQGGPIINDSGQVVAVASRSYAPLGFTSDGTYFVPYIQAACNKVLSCPGGTLSGNQ